MKDENDWKEDVLRHLRGVFEELDINHDGVLQKEEVQENHRPTDGESSDIEAQVIALFSFCFEEIGKLNKESWFEKRNGITIGDLLVLEQLLREEDVDSLSLDRKRLKGAAEAIMKRTREIYRLNPALFGSDGEALTSVRPLAVRRGNMGDCHFLAVLAAMAAMEPEALASMIAVGEDRSYTVSFPGGISGTGGGVRVKRPGVVELSLYGRLTRMGYWPMVLEKAVQSELEMTSLRKVVDPAFYLELLTGAPALIIDLAGITPDLISSTLFEYRKRPMVAVSASTSLAKGLNSDHAYSVIAVDSAAPSTFRITLRDPFGPKHPAATSSGRLKDGMFSIDPAEFAGSFQKLFIAGSKRQ
ncbi:hypothetical protein GC174_03090 [bacterium]|nr:hypothetical protein [bacterium]